MFIQYKKSLEEHEELCNKHGCCRIEMPKWFEKALKHNRGEKSLKAPFIIFTIRTQRKKPKTIV